LVSVRRSCAENASLAEGTLDGEAMSALLTRSIADR
jgi:hypothetical protein